MKPICRPAASRLVLCAAVLAALAVGCARSRPPEPALSLDAIDSEQIAAEDRIIGQPKEVAAVLGSQRGRPWNAAVSVDFLSDGRLVSVDTVGNVRFWDPATLRERAALTWDPTTLPGAAEPSLRLRALRWSPDGRLAVTIGEDGRLCLWEVKGERLALRSALELPHGQRDRIWQAGPVFSPDGAWLAWGGDKGGPIVCPVRDARLGVPQELPVDCQRVSALAFSPDARTLAITGEDGNLRLWTVGAGAREFYRLRVEGRWPRPLCFTPDGKALLFGCNPVSRLDLSGDVPKGPFPVLEIPEVERRGRVLISAMCMSAEGKTLALLTEIGMREDPGPVPQDLRIWDLSGSKPVERAFLPHAVEDFSRVSFSPDGKLLAGIGTDNQIRLWDLSGPELVLRGRQSGHTEGIAALAFSPDGKLLATGDNDHAARLWDLATSRPSQQVCLEDRHSETRFLAFSADGKLLGSGDGFRHRLWDLKGETPRAWPPPAPTGPVVKFDPPPRNPGPARREKDGFYIAQDWLALSPDGKTLAAFRAGEVRLWAVLGENPAEFARLTPDKLKPALATFSADGKFLALADRDNTVPAQVWDVSSSPPQLAARVPAAHARPLRTLALSPDGKTFASAGEDWAVEVWDLSGATPQPKATLLAHAATVAALAFAPGGSALLSADEAGHVVVWDVAGHRPRHEWKLPGAVHALAFAPDGRHFATANANGTAYIWRLPPAGTEAPPPACWQPRRGQRNAGPDPK